MEAGTPVGKFPIVNLSTEVNLFYTTCVTILIYGYESWVISHDMISKINTFATSCYRIVLNMKQKRSCSKHHNIFHDQHRAPYSPCSKSPVAVTWAHPRFPTRRACKNIAPHGNRRPRRPRTSYLAYIQRLLKYEEGSIQANQIATLAKDRSAWRSLVVEGLLLFCCCFVLFVIYSLPSEASNLVYSIFLYFIISLYWVIWMKKVIILT